MNLRSPLLWLGVTVAVSSPLISLALIGDPPEKVRQPSTTLAEQAVEDGARELVPPPSPRVARPPAEEAPVERARAAEPLDATQLGTDLEVLFAASAPKTPEKRVLEQNLRDHFLSPELPKGTSLDELECRSTVCKAKVSSSSFDAYKSAISQVFVDPTTAIDTGMTLIFPEQETHPDGSHHATFYLVPPDFSPAAEGG